MNSSATYDPNSSEFHLIGLSWIQDQQLFVSLLFLLIYVLTILGNCGVCFLIKNDEKLHEPMHIFISLMTVIDFSISSVVTPKMLSILWLQSDIIHSNMCITQIYFLYTLISLESSLFTLMSFDRYVAICHPLRHSAIVTSTFIIKALLFNLMKSIVFISPVPLLTATVTYCKSKILRQSHCDYTEVVQLSCEDLTYHTIYMILLVCIFSGGDNVVTIFSYVMILRVVNKLQSKEAQWKSLGTCTSHAIVLSLFYIIGSFPFFLYLYYPHTPLYIKTLLEVLNFLILPMINPVVYGAKTKKIQEAFRRLFLKWSM